jgi:hypothetical protein
VNLHIKKSDSPLGVISCFLHSLIYVYHADDETDTTELQIQFFFPCEVQVFFTHSLLWDSDEVEGVFESAVVVADIPCSL